MKQALVLFFTLSMTCSAYSAEPLRVDDWRLHSPFLAGFTSGLTFGLASHDIPHTIEQDIPSRAEMPLGLVPYVQHNNRFAINTGRVIGFLISFITSVSLLFGLYFRLKHKL